MNNLTPLFICKPPPATIAPEPAPATTDTHVRLGPAETKLHTCVYNPAPLFVVPPPVSPPWETAPTTVDAWTRGGPAQEPSACPLPNPSKLI